VSRREDVLWRRWDCDFVERPPLRLIELCFLGGFTGATHGVSEAERLTDLVELSPLPGFLWTSSDFDLATASLALDLVDLSVAAFVALGVSSSALRSEMRLLSLQELSDDGSRSCRSRGKRLDNGVGQTAMYSPPRRGYIPWFESLAIE
jgi:hypothetical protein